MKMQSVTAASLITFAVVCSLTFFPPQAKAQGLAVRTLVVGQAVTAELTSGQVHTYRIALSSGQYFRAVAEQQDVEIVVKFLGIDGRQLAESRNPHPDGFESITHIADSTGDYSLQIQLQDQSTSGRYDLRLEEIRPSTSDDKERLAAEQLYFAGAALSAIGNSSSRLQAIDKFTAALQIRRKLGDGFDEGVILHSIGQTFAANGERQTASDYYQQALARFQRGQSWDGLFKNLSFLYTVMGGKQKAFDYLADALPLVRAMRNRRLEAALLIGIAKIHEDLNQPAEALAAYHHSLVLYRASGGQAGETVTLSNIADADLTLAQRQKAIQYLNQSLIIISAVGDKSLEATNLFAIGYVHNMLDEKQKALEYFERALPLYRDLGDRNSEAYLLNFIGGFYFGLGEDLKAQDYFEQSLPLFRAVGDNKAQGYALMYLGSVSFRLGNVTTALNYQQQALQLFRATNDRYGEAEAINILGVIFWTQGEKQKAIEWQQEALKIWRAIGYRSNEAITLNNLGFMDEAEGSLESAIVHHRQALALHRLLGDRSEEAQALYGLARIQRRQVQLGEALINIKAALEIIESLRGDYTSPDLRASFLATNQHFYNFHIDLLMQMHQQKPAAGFDGLALQASERARVRSLLETLSEARVDIRAGVDANLLARERQLQQQLNEQARKRMQLLKRKPSPEQLAAAEKELRAIAVEYQEVQARIRAQSPRYAALTQPQPLSYKEIQQVLDPDTLLLEYALGEERSYLWIVSPASLKSYQLPRRAEVEAAARNYYEVLINTDPASRRQLPTTAAKLSEMLLGPDAAQLGKKRLLIVADGALQYVPFAALPVASRQLSGDKGGGKSNGQRTTDNGQPLIVNHEIVTLPSASALAVLRRETTGRRTAPKTLAILADPVFSASDSRVTSSSSVASANPTITQSRDTIEQLLRSASQVMTQNAELRIPRLPGTRREAAAILKLIPEAEIKQAFDFEANRNVVISADFSQYRYIHFATHGLLNSEHPELSGIVLSLVNQQGQPQEGFLRLHEIYNLKMPAELVVLSACQTALGKEVRGEGLVGLTRGFMYAGAPRVVASLWKVDDKATAELMRQFYQAMLSNKQLPPAAALRAAQVELSKSKGFADPYYWAAFVLQGEWK